MLQNLALPLLEFLDLLERGAVQTLVVAILSRFYLVLALS